MRRVRFCVLCRSWKEAVNPVAGDCHRGVTEQEPVHNAVSSRCMMTPDILTRSRKSINF